MRATQISTTVGPHPTMCDYCGGEVEELGLFAPYCAACDRFSMSHVTFHEPVEVELDVDVEFHDDGSATLRFGEES